MKRRYLLPLLFAALVSTSSATPSNIVVNTFTNFEAQAFTPLVAPWGDGSSTNNDQVIQGTNYITIAPVNGGNPTGDGSFVSVISGTSSSPGAALDFTGYNYLFATARVNAGNASTIFTVQLLDSAFNEAAVATFSASSFTSSFTTFAVALTATPQFGGNITQIQYFYLTGDGQSSDAVNLSLQNLTASTAVPEPSAYALFGLGLGGLYLVLNKRRKSA